MQVDELQVLAQNRPPMGFGIFRQPKEHGHVDLNQQLSLDLNHKDKTLKQTMKNLNLTDGILLTVEAKG